MQFEIGGAPMTADLKISGFPEKPQVGIKASAAEMKPLEAWKAALAAAVPLTDVLDAELRADAEAAWDACQDLARDPDILILQRHSGFAVLKSGQIGVGIAQI